MKDYSGYPDENREDLWEILESVGLDYYDRFEWLLRTTMRAANDNLIVERKRAPILLEDFTSVKLSDLQYGDKLVVAQRLIAISELIANRKKELNRLKKPENIPAENPST